IPTRTVARDLATAPPGAVPETTLGRDGKRRRARGVRQVLVRSAGEQERLGRALGNFGWVANELAAGPLEIGDVERAVGVGYRARRQVEVEEWTDAERFA